MLLCSKPEIIVLNLEWALIVIRWLSLSVTGSDLWLLNRSWKWVVSDKSESLDWVFQSLSIVWLKFAWLRVTANKICVIVHSFTSILQSLLRMSYWKPKRFYFASNDKQDVKCCLPPQAMGFVLTIQVTANKFCAIVFLQFFHEQVKRHRLTFFSYHLFKTCYSCPVIQENVTFMLMNLYSHNRLSMFMIIAQMNFL